MTETVEGKATQGRTLTRLAAQEALGIGSTVFYKLVSSGELKTLKICGSRRVRVEEIEDFLRRQEEAATVEVDKD